MTGTDAIELKGWASLYTYKLFFSLRIWLIGIKTRVVASDQKVCTVAQ